MQFDRKIYFYCVNAYKLQTTFLKILFKINLILIKFIYTSVKTDPFMCLSFCSFYCVNA